MFPCRPEFFERHTDAAERLQAAQDDIEAMFEDAVNRGDIEAVMSFGEMSQNTQSRALASIIARELRELRKAVEQLKTSRTNSKS